MFKHLFFLSLVSVGSLIYSTATLAYDPHMLKCESQCPATFYSDEYDQATCINECITVERDIWNIDYKPGASLNNGANSNTAAGSENKTGATGSTTGSTTNSTPRSTNPNVAEDFEVPCNEDFSAEIASCERELASASDACDENSSALSNVSNLISQATVYVGQKSASSITESCSKMATFGKGISAGLMGYRLYCKNAINSCSAVCSANLIPKCPANAKSNMQVMAAQKNLRNLKSSCQTFTRKMDQAAAAAENYAAISLNAQDCASLTSAVSNGPTELCIKNPNYPGCGGASEEKMDCDNPKMSGTKVCVCKNNPQDAMCMNSASSFNQTANVEIANRKKNEKSDFKDLSKQEKLEQAERLPTSADTSIDGKQGHLNLGSPALAVAAGTRIKGKKSISDRSVLGGFYGGAGKAAIKNEAEPLAIIEKEPSRGPASTDDEEEQLSISAEDLKRFLPGNPMAPQRGIAGSSDRVGEDGITGPHSNIWGKVKNRYEAVKGTLLP
ncbi:hypothetical protein [Bdellovibrio reynosensis]|uniref:Uncharacterized protein n=1 Tax=Bdellovibrio reynosensis TaxID=2835041 RepID=A0ABY4C9J9_9BACT|nr:hypothetical protein [Bdellovibrio reynosensis]UOF01404.1 hypothetical protein MNR06_00360 [Bdellovibrio reynosensis]